MLEEGLPERDALFSYWQNETDPDFHRRVGSGIAAICASTTSTFLAMVSHRMTTDEFLSSVEHRPWQLATADMVPVVVSHTLGSDSSLMASWRSLGSRVIMSRKAQGA